MNFTQEIKRELSKKLFREEEGLCLLGGVLDTSGRLFGEGFSFTSENEGTAQSLLSLVERLFCEEMTLTDAAYDPKHGRDKLTFTLAGDFAPRILGAVSEADDGGALAYLKGAFLGGGSCTLPRAGTKTGYHLEFTFPSGEKAERFCGMLDRLGFVSSVTERGDRSVVYIKSREAISDFLSVVGADNALEKFNEVSAAREESNAENRAINCSAGNADRAAIASVEQVRAFTALKASGRLKELPSALQATASARLTHPELSLSELAALMGVTKSCLNHRLRKLMDLSRHP